MVRVRFWATFIFNKLLPLNRCVRGGQRATRQVDIGRRVLPELPARVARVPHTRGQVSRATEPAAVQNTAVPASLASLHHPVRAPHSGV